MKIMKKFSTLLLTGVFDACNECTSFRCGAGNWESE